LGHPCGILICAARHIAGSWLPGLWKRVVGVAPSEQIIFCGWFSQGGCPGLWSGCAVGASVGQKPFGIGVTSSLFKDQFAGPVPAFREHRAINNREDWIIGFHPAFRNGTFSAVNTSADAMRLIEQQSLSSLSGLICRCLHYPPINRWAIFDHPCGIFTCKEYRRKWLPSYGKRVSGVTRVGPQLNAECRMVQNHTRHQHEKPGWSGNRSNG
jgi:hypothetical protein